MTRLQVSFISVVVAGALAASGTCLSMPLKPEVIEKLKKEGKWESTVELLKEDREKGINAGGRLVPLIRRDGLEGIERLQDQQWSIERQAIVILVDFSDNVADTLNYPPSHYSDMLFSVGTYSTGSMADYYLENSYGEFLVTGTVTRWYRMPHTYAYYVDGKRGFGTYPHNAQKLAEDAVYAADPDVDFSQFDNDGPDGIPDSGDDDGMIDALFVVHAGPGYEETGDPDDVHSHQWSTYYAPAVDGVLAVTYSMEPENGRIGVFGHEFGHVLGLPDLYDYGYDSKGLGMWSMMAYGSWANNGRTPVHFDAWCKAQLGFVSPLVVTSSIIGASVPNVENSPTAYRLWTEGAQEPQYFLAENRQRTGFDSYAPGYGLLIYHVDETIPNNNNQTHYKVAVEQADGMFHLENNVNGGDLGDSWPGSSNSRNFGPTSTPNSDDYLGNDTQVSVLNISNSGMNMTADLYVECAGTNSIAGRVTDAQSGLGQEGVVVTATGVTSAADTTDANGNYGLAGLCAGTYTVVASGFDCWQSDPETVTVPPSATGVDFEFSTPAAHLVSPNGGQAYGVSTVVLVSWEACDPDGIDSVTISFSTDGGNTFPTTIAHGIPDSPPYPWTTPDQPYSQCRIKVTVYDSLGNSDDDMSDSDFQISDLDGPSVTVVSPNGYEWFEMGQQALIEWLATDDGGVDSVSIFLSIDDGASYPYQIASGEENDSEYLWTVSETPGDLCRIKIVAYDGALNTGQDESDFPFIIGDMDPPSVTVVAPNGGEMWAAGSQQNIRWIAADNDSVSRIDIRYSTNGGTSYPNIITANTPNDSLYEWTVPATISNNCKIRIVAYDRSYNSANDVSDAVFSIVYPDTIPPTVTVTEPDGGEEWIVGTQQEIAWIASDANGVDSVGVFVSVDGGITYPHLVATGEPNDSSFTWTVEDLPSDSCKIKVVAYDPSRNTGFDVSNGLFSIIPPDTVPPQVLVVSPNGGEEWTVGSDVVIEWVVSDAAGVDSVSILLSLDGGTTYPHLIASGEPNDSSLAWTVADWQSDSCVIKIVAYDPSLNAGFGVSDSLFTIETITTVPDEHETEIRLPERTRLAGCFPNPFNPAISIRIELAQDEHVSLCVFDVQGRRIREIEDRLLTAGTHTLQWDGRADSGANASSGVFLIRLRAGAYTATGKVVLLR